MSAWLRYRRRLREKLIAERGGACEECGDRDGPLEFAHVKPTALRGEGRGSSKRVHDVRRHPECYRLLCKSCHDELDLGVRRQVVAA